MQEDFCQAYVFLTNFNIDEAIEIAGFTSKDRHDTRRALMQNPRVKKRISELISGRDTEVTFDRTYVRSHLKRIVEESDKNSNAKIKALELLGKDLGMFGKEDGIIDNKDPSAIAKQIFENRKARLLNFKKGGNQNVNNENLAIPANNM
jgi:hypothetical protein